MEKWLKAGPLDVMIYHHTIKYIKWKGLEIVRGIYPAVRDQNWNTIVPVYTIIEEAIGKDHFTLRYQATYQSEDIYFVSDYEIIATSHGEITYRMDGSALSTFLRNRIGFCFLHPANICKGASCQITHTDGTSENTLFPVDIAPHQPFLDIKSIKWGAAHGYNAEVQFEGDIFETEDQRNWTDASYKTYCTPLAIPLPAKVLKNEQIRQTVKFSCKPFSDSPKIAFTSGEALSSGAIKKPLLGLGISSYDKELTSVQTDYLKALSINHLRADIYLFQPQWKKSLEAAIDQSLRVGVKLELFVHFIHTSEILFFTGLEQKTHNLYTITLLRFRKCGLDDIDGPKSINIIKSAYPGIPLGIGTDSNFAELNRAHMALDHVDFVSFSITPQVHATDDLTIMENIEAQYDVVQCATKISGGKPVHISTVTLKRRFNAVDQDLMRISLPEKDARQKEEICALWTRASINTLTQAGAASITYFETTGPCGVLDNDPYPVYEVFK